MTTATYTQGAVGATLLDLASLAPGTFAVTPTIDFGASIPYDTNILVTANTATNATSAGQQVVVYMQQSPDGTTWTSGPTSGTTATNEFDLIFLGYVPMQTGGTTMLSTEIFSIRKDYPVTRYARIVIKNDCGLALSAGGVFRFDVTLNQA
jgi:hypothetical protein